MTFAFYIEVYFIRMPPWFSMPNGAFTPGPLSLSPPTPPPTSKDCSTLHRYHENFVNKICSYPILI